MRRLDGGVEAAEPMMRRATLDVVYDDHKMSNIDWGYHLRMGGVDAEDVIVGADVEVKIEMVEIHRPDPTHKEHGT